MSGADLTDIKFMVNNFESLQTKLQNECLDDISYIVRIQNLKNKYSQAIDLLKQNHERGCTFSCQIPTQFLIIFSGYHGNAQINNASANLLVSKDFLSEEVYLQDKWLKQQIPITLSVKRLRKIDPNMSITVDEINEQSILEDDHEKKEKQKLIKQIQQIEENDQSSLIEPLKEQKEINTLMQQLNIETDEEKNKPLEMFDTLNEISEIRYEPDYEFLNDQSFNGEHIILSNLQIQSQHEPKQITFYTEQANQKKKIVRINNHNEESSRINNIRLPGFANNIIQLQFQDEGQNIKGIIKTQNQNKSLLYDCEGKKVGSMIYHLRQIKKVETQTVDLMPIADESEDQDIIKAEKSSQAIQNKFDFTLFERDHHQYTSSQEQPLSCPNHYRVYNIQLTENKSDTLKESKDMGVSKFQTLKEQVFLNKIDQQGYDKTTSEQSSYLERSRIGIEKDQEDDFLQGEQKYQYKSPIQFMQKQKGIHQSYQVDFEHLNQKKKELGIEEVSMENIFLSRFSKKPQEANKISQVGSEKSIKSQKKSSLPISIMASSIKELQPSIQHNRNRKKTFNTLCQIQEKPKKNELLQKQKHKALLKPQQKEIQLNLNRKIIEYAIPPTTELKKKGRYSKIYTQTNRSPVSELENEPSQIESQYHAIIKRQRDEDHQSNREFDFVINNLSINFHKKTFGRKHVQLNLAHHHYTTEKLHGNNLIWIGKGYLFRKVQSSSDLNISVFCENQECEQQLGKVKINVRELLITQKQCYYQTFLIKGRDILAILILGFEVIKQNSSSNLNLIDSKTSRNNKNKSYSYSESHRKRRVDDEKIEQASPPTVLKKNSGKRQSTEKDEYAFFGSRQVQSKVNPIRIRKFTGGKNIKIGRANRFQKQEIVQEAPGPGKYEIESEFSRHAIKQF